MKKISILFIALVLSMNSFAKEIDGDFIPPMPDMKLNNSTLLGIDSDNDGVRDDVELWINEKISNSKIRISLKNLAKVMNERISIAFSPDVEMIKDKLKRDLKVTTCFARRMIEEDDLHNTYLKDLNKAQHNTLDRMKAYATIQSYTGGFEAPEYDPNPCND